MTGKKVSFGAIPPSGKLQAADAWVATREPDAPETGVSLQEPVKRLNILLPVSLHVRIKTACAQRGTNMSDEIRVLLEKAFPDKS